MFFFVAPALGVLRIASQTALLVELNKFLARVLVPRLPHPDLRKVPPHCASSLAEAEKEVIDACVRNAVVSHALVTVRPPPCSTGCRAERSYQVDADAPIADAGSHVGPGEEVRQVQPHGACLENDSTPMTNRSPTQANARKRCRHPVGSTSDQNDKSYTSRTREGERLLMHTLVARPSLKTDSEIAGAEAPAPQNPIVLLHGHGMCAAFWAGTFDAFLDMGYDAVYAPDLMGWGRSSRPQFACGSECPSPDGQSSEPCDDQCNNSCSCDPEGGLGEHAQARGAPEAGSTESVAFMDLPSFPPPPSPPPATAATQGQENANAASKSGVDCAELGLSFFLDALDDWLHAMGLGRGHPGAPRFAVCGHSLGGYLAHEFAKRHGESVSRLVLTSPAAIEREIPLATAAWFATTPQKVIKHGGLIALLLFALQYPTEASYNTPGLRDLLLHTNALACGSGDAAAASFVRFLVDDPTDDIAREKDAARRSSQAAAVSMATLSQEASSASAENARSGGFGRALYAFAESSIPQIVQCLRSFIGFAKACTGVLAALPRYRAECARPLIEQVVRYSYPVELIAGDQDVLVSLGSIRALHRAMLAKGNIVKLNVLQSADHTPQICAPKVFAEALVRGAPHILRPERETRRKRRWRRRTWAH